MSATNDTPRNSKLTARLTNADYVKLKKLSKASGKSISQVAREVIAKGLRLLNESSKANEQLIEGHAIDA